MGADRPLVGYKDERREIHLAEKVERIFPLERPTLELDCEQCEQDIVVYYELSTPHNVECPNCGHENCLMRCIHCKSEWQEGDQGFIEFDVPYGSTVHDSLFDGPAYACSSKCLVEAFRNDDFEAKNMFPRPEVVPRTYAAVTGSLNELFGQAREYFGDEHAEIAKMDALVESGLEKLSRDDEITDEMLCEAYAEPIRFVLESFPRERNYTQSAEIFNTYMWIVKRLWTPEELDKFDEAEQQAGQLRSHDE